MPAKAGSQGGMYHNISGFLGRWFQKRPYHLHPCRRRPPVPDAALPAYIPVGEGAQGENSKSPCFKISDLCHSRVIGLWGGASLCRKEARNKSEPAIFSGGHFCPRRAVVPASAVIPAFAGMTAEAGMANECWRASARLRRECIIKSPDSSAASSRRGPTTCVPAGVGRLFQTCPRRAGAALARRMTSVR